MFSCLKASPASGIDRSQSRVYQKEKKMRKTHNENPFADRGLDRFAMVSAELQEKREKIIAQLGANQADNIMVRFTYSNSLGWVPMVSRLNSKEENDLNQKKEEKDGKNQKKKTENSAKQKPKTFVVDDKLSESPMKVAEKKGIDRDVQKSTQKESASDSKTASISWFRRKEAFCWPLVTTLILFCLLLFGKTFAILCTAIWWYLMGCLKETSVVGKESKCYIKKKKSKDTNRLLVDEESCIRRTILK